MPSISSQVNLLRPTSRAGGALTGTVKTVLIPALAVAALAGCQRGAGPAAGHLREDGLSTQPGGVPTDMQSGRELRLAQVTPELTKKSALLLEQHAEEPIGTQLSFTLNGQQYVARIEAHEDSAKGKHKGLTIYVPNSATNAHAKSE